MSAAQCLDDRDFAELMGRQAGEPAIERPDRGTRGAGNDDIGNKDILKR